MYIFAFIRIIEMSINVNVVVLLARHGRRALEVFERKILY